MVVILSDRDGCEEEGVVGRDLYVVTLGVSIVCVVQLVTRVNGPNLGVRYHKVRRVS